MLSLAGVCKSQFVRKQGVALFVCFFVCMPENESELHCVVPVAYLLTLSFPLFTHEEANTVPVKG